MAQALLAVADVLKCLEISFKFIPKILMSKECLHFFGPLCRCCLSVSMLAGPRPVMDLDGATIVSCSSNIILIRTLFPLSVSHHSHTVTDIM